MLNNWWPPGHLLSKLYCDELLTVFLQLGCPSYVCLLSLDQIEVRFVSIREISRDKLGSVSILQSAACVSYQCAGGFLALQWIDRTPPLPSSIFVALPIQPEDADDDVDDLVYFFRELILY